MPDNQATGRASLFTLRANRPSAFFFKVCLLHATSGRKDRLCDAILPGDFGSVSMGVERH
jgi:hypothetical protein